MPEKKSVSNDEFTGDGYRHPSHEIYHEDIAKLAYALWEARGGGDGRADQDWFEAVEQLQLVLGHGREA